MKKVITAGVLVAFMGAVAFASLESKDSGKNVKNKEQQKNEQKETKKKKECRRTCLFS
ncbi:MAG TPA: hypothetical protein VD996_04830 [Chitinophagaceae bacterium]|nr:hypothetical protein [Chitinophagaceae bacterium]